MMFLQNSMGAPGEKRGTFLLVSALLDALVGGGGEDEANREQTERRHKDSLGR